MSWLKRKTVIHERYYVYRLSVGRYHYYGITYNMGERFKCHSENILFEANFTNVGSNGNLQAHAKMAKHLVFMCKRDRIKYLAMIKQRIIINLCFETKSIDEAREVEKFLIKKSKAPYCCNTRHFKLQMDDHA